MNVELNVEMFSDNNASVYLKTIKILSYSLR